MKESTGPEERESVRELLGRAVADVRPPAGRDGESVFTTAARIRRRRRAAATGAVAGVIAVSAALGPGVLRADDDRTPVAASPTVRAAFQDLLPKGVGKITKISLEKILTGSESAPSETIGPYDGEYAVARGGGVGILTVRVVDVATQRGYKKGSVDTTPCKVPGQESSYPRQQCTDEAVAGGRLSMWQYLSTNRSDGSSLTAQLLLKDGTVLTVNAWEGFSGRKALGPLLKGFPLNREQLRELVLRKELLP
ncbi:hypothetical protein [Streptomyces sp. NPDC006334]|uniref:hypothetical protein n=1 Tax=Streptomyces sp. NPDC006334 TaxID=3156754 RepID=UPI0033A59D72